MKALVVIPIILFSIVSCKKDETSNLNMTTISHVEHITAGTPGYTDYFNYDETQRLESVSQIAANGDVFQEHFLNYNGDTLISIETSTFAYDTLSYWSYYSYYQDSIVKTTIYENNEDNTKEVGIVNNEGEIETVLSYGFSIYSNTFYLQSTKSYEYDAKNISKLTTVMAFDSSYSVTTYHDFTNVVDPANYSIFGSAFEPISYNWHSFEESKHYDANGILEDQYSYTLETSYDIHENGYLKSMNLDGVDSYYYYLD